MTQIQEIQEIQRFVDTFSNDPRMKDVIAALRQALALDRQDIRKNFKLVEA